MMMQPKSPIVIAAVLLLGFSAFAVARDSDRVVPDGAVPMARAETTEANGLCPPSACTIVFKTDEGGPPSRIIHVE